MGFGVLTRRWSHQERGATFLRLACVVGSLLAASGCGSKTDGSSSDATGGALGTGGSVTGGTGAGGLVGGTGGVAPITGGAAAVGGATGGMDGMTGGTSGSGGATGGVATGGTAGATGGLGGLGTGGASGGTGGGTGGLGGATGGSGGATGGLGGLSTGGASGGVGGLGTGGASDGGASTGGEAGTGGATPGPCAFECVDQCAELGGTVEDGTCDGAQICCQGATALVNPLADLVPSAESVGLLLAQRFNGKPVGFSSVSSVTVDGGQYKVACEWYGALSVAGLTDEQTLLSSLVTKFDPLKGDFVSAMTGGEAHVDRYVFGIVPLEIFLQTDDSSYVTLGSQVADRQQTTNQTRGAIDDMFMMTGLQLQAYRATGDAKYVDYMSGVMVDYLAEQQSNGLFFHNVSQAPVHWCRGNGWFAAGMAEMLKDLPTSSSDYATIEAGYKKMMEGLLPLQGPNGLWYQVLNLPDDPANWEETSGSAMFTYAMVAGVRRGILDAATYVPVIEAAWEGLQGRISGSGDVSGICTGTWYHSTPQEYMSLTQLTGDGHGQAPVLWTAAEILRTE